MLRITEPFHGAVLNHRHGEQSEDALTVSVAGEAPLGEAVKVNGIGARRAGTRFEAKVPLTERESDITATCAGAGGAREHRVRVVWDRHSKPRYRLGIDDNIFFLRDIARAGYRSLFDCFYLDILRRLNREYGTKFSLNLFYVTGERDFSLGDFPERYRGEWEENAGWLKLTFHAQAEFPDRPYQQASAEKLGEDFDLVKGEIERFAGEETWAPPTIIHWGMVHPAAMPALVERKVKVLSGFFVRDSGSDYTADGERGEEDTAPASGTLWDINYMLDAERSEYLSRHDALMDFETGITFSRVDMVLNSTPLERIVPELEALAAEANHAEVMDLLTHEQYFWPFYHNHRPDHAERLETAIRFVSERGYEPVFFHEGFLGGRQ